MTGTIRVAPPRLDHVDTWVFDLDNTLYAPAAGLLDQVNLLMTAYIAEKLRLTEAEASRLRQDYWQRYGATMTGLVEEHAVDADEFLAACHAIDLAALAPDKRLSAAIAELPGRRLIHTNGPRHHAERVLEALGLGHHFACVITIEDTGYRPKPAEAAHHRAVEIAELVPERTVMIDDMADNLAHPRRLGMTTVWVRHDPDHPEPDHADHQTADLTEFLLAVVEARQD